MLIYDSELIFVGWQVSLISLQIYFKFRNRSTWLNKVYLIVVTYSSRVQISLALNPNMVHSFFVGIVKPQMHYFHQYFSRKYYLCLVVSSHLNLWLMFLIRFTHLTHLYNFSQEISFIWPPKYVAAHILKSKTLKQPRCKVLHPLFRHLLNVKTFHSALCFLLPSCFLKTRRSRKFLMWSN
jgi:hypothetical protein